MYILSVRNTVKVCCHNRAEVQFGRAADTEQHLHYISKKEHPSLCLPTLSIIPHEIISTAYEKEPITLTDQFQFIFLNVQQSFRLI